MKILKITVFSLLVVCLSCQNAGKEKNDDKENITTTTISETVGFSELSIYNLPSQWTDQDGKQIQMQDLKGKVLTMVMIYTSCNAACPKLVADMRNIDKQIPNNLKNEIQYVFISIDPKTDTPERLNDFAKENKMDDDKWIFMRGTEEDTREFAAVLAVNYKQISPMDFSHSNIISVFNKKGELVHQREGLGVDTKETVAVIIEEAE